MTASSKGHHLNIQILLNSGAVIDVEVMKAAMDEKTLQLILDRGGDPGLRDAQGRALCHHAASQGNIRKLEMLAKLGSDLTVIDKQGRTCLHHAVTCQTTSAAVVWLLDKGHGVNITDRDGWTPLHWAAKCGDPYIIAALQDAGAEFCRENIRGWTPKVVALFHGHTDLWETGTALKSKSKPSKPNLEDELSTAHSMADERGIGGLPFLGKSPYYWVCDGCNIVSRFSIALRIKCNDNCRIYAERGILV